MVAREIQSRLVQLEEEVSAPLGFGQASTSGGRPVDTAVTGYTRTDRFRRRHVGDWDKLVVLRALAFACRLS